MLFRDETRNNLCTEEQFVRDAFCGKDASLHAKMVVQGCIRGEEIIPAVKKSELGMKLSGRHHPCRRKKQAGDETGRKKSSLRKKKASWG